MENNENKNENKNESVNESKQVERTPDRPLHDPEPPQDKEKKPSANRPSFSAITKVTLEWLKGYWYIIRDWFTGKNISKTDRWAFAVCFVMAVVVWLYVMSTNDTGYEKEVSSVVVDIEGISSLNSQNMSIINGFDNLVTIKLKGKRADIGALTAEDLRVYIDVSQVTETGRLTLPVNIELPKNSSLVSIEPSQVNVSVDVNSSVEVDLKVKMDYVLDASYKLSEPLPDHKTVVVSGPASVLETIKYAAVTFNPGVIEKSLNLVGTVYLYDEYDKVINNPYLKCNVSEVTVEVRVTTTKTVPLKINFTNGISTNYTVTMQPSEVTLIGDPLLLRDINEIIAYTVNDGDIQVGEPKIKYISNLDLPDGVTMEESEKGVSIIIERNY